MTVQLVVAQEYAFSMTVVIDVNLVYGQSKYVFLNTAADCITHLGDFFHEAVRNSSRWKSESYIGGLAIEIPYALNEDGLITIVIGQERGFDVIRGLGVQPIWRTLQ